MTDTMGRLLWDSIIRHGPEIALAQGERTQRYDELGARAGALAQGLAARGVRPGDRVASFVDDRIESVEVFVACALGGFTLVPVNARFRAGEATHVVHDSGAAALIHTTTLTEEVLGIDGLDELRTIVAIGAGERPRSAIDHDELIAGADSFHGPAGGIGPDDVAVIGYTSGTTGFPKGALVSHRAAVTCTRLVPFVQGMPARGCCAFVGSFSFVSALWGILWPHLWTGGSLRIIEPGDVDLWFDHMRHDRATYTWVPSPLLPVFGERLAADDDVRRGLRTVVHTGSKVRSELLAGTAALVGGRLVETWGLTESVGPLTATTASDVGDRCRADDLWASVGRPVPTAEVAVIGRDGSVTREAGVSGELVARADTMFSGYLGRPEADVESWLDGWFRTGDVGRLDAAGYVYIDDRSKDVIVSGGMNVYPVEVELALGTLPGVSEAAVFGVPDSRWGETVAAAVVVVAGHTLSADDVIAHVRSQLASFKKPTRVFFVDVLPRNASMKVQKHLLRQQLVGGGR